jgi:hypothetical protein
MSPENGELVRELRTGLDKSRPRGNERRRCNPKVLIAALAATLAFAGVALAGNGGRPLSTPMTGEEEAPNLGDLGATGQADLRLNQGKERICFELSWADIDGTVFAAHIHKADVGVAGGIVVPLFEGTFAGTDAFSDCVDVDKGLIKDIRQHPEEYYVNVHSSPTAPGDPDFRAGAVRGQLEK